MRYLIFAFVLLLPILSEAQVFTGGRWRVNATITGAQVALSTSNQASYTGIEDAGLTLANVAGTGTKVITAQIPCSSTNSPSGTTCSSGSESIGVSFTPPGNWKGDLLACVSFGWFVNPNVSSVSHVAFQIVQTPANAQTISAEGGSKIPATFSSPAAGGLQAVFPFRVCGNFTVAAAGQITLRLFYEFNNGSGTVASHSVMADASASVGQRNVHWEVYPLNP